MKPPVIELRVAVTAKDYAAVLAFYQDALGLEPAQLWTTGDAHAVIFDMGGGTLEVFDEAQAALVDDLEAGKRVSGPIRFALRVPDLDAAIKRLVSKGATIVHEPVVTPWQDYNARVQSPDGFQITLFQPLTDSDND